MTVRRRDDLTYSILLITPVLLYTSMGGDPLYTGIWYLVGKCPRNTPCIVKRSPIYAAVTL